MTDLDWISFRAAQSYPLADEASGVSLTGNPLPQSLLLDIQLLLPSKYNQNISGSFYISQIRDMGTSLSVVISYNNIECALCAGIPKTLTATSTISQRTFTITGTVTDAATLQTYPWMNRITGSLCAGMTADYSGGSLVFNLQSARIHSMCVHFIGGDHLEAFIIDGKYLTGVITFKAGQGILISNRGDNTIDISVDPAYIESKWAQNIADYISSKETAGATPIKTINGVRPDESGNINIRGLDCVDVQGIAGGITISNPCAKPCCNQSTALQNMQTNVKMLQSQQKILHDYYVNMSNVVNYMQVNLATLMNT